MSTPLFTEHTGLVLVPPTSGGSASPPTVVAFVAVLLVSRDPAGKSYKTQLSLRRGESISPVAFPDVVFKIEDLLG